MMMQKLSRFIVPVNDPLLIAEEVINRRGWSYERPSEAEVTVSRQGSWGSYHLYMAWLEEMQIMQFCCVYGFSVKNVKHAQLHELLSLLNERMWLGHFEYDSVEQTVLFRHNMRVIEQEQNMGQQIDDLMHIALEQCEKFYPAFQFVLWGGKTPAEAIDACLLPVAGHA